MSAHVERWSRHKHTQLVNAIKVLEEQGLEVPPELVGKAEEVGLHLDEVEEMHIIITSGTAISDHTENVVDWLLEKGWFAPEGSSLLIREDGS